MSEGDNNKSGVSSALLSIASAYSDSESSEEVGDDSAKATRRTLGSLVENLRAEAKEDIEKTTSEEAEAVEEQGDSKSKAEETEKKQPVIKIVRLDSGKVVKLSTSPNKVESHANEELKREDKEGKSEENKMGGLQSTYESKKSEKIGEFLDLEIGEDNDTNQTPDVSIPEKESENAQDGYRNDADSEKIKSIRSDNSEQSVSTSNDLQKSNQSSASGSSSLPANELDEAKPCKIPPKADLSEKTEKIIAEISEELDSAVQAKKIKAELIENVLEAQNDKNAVTETEVQEKCRENVQTIQVEEKSTPEKIISATVSTENNCKTEISANLKTKQIESQNIATTVTQFSVTATKSDVNKSEGDESKNPCVSAHDKTTSSSVENLLTTVENNSNKKEIVSDIDKKAAVTDKKIDDDDIQIEREIPRHDKPSTASRPFETTENILKKALSAEGRNFPRMEDFTSRSVLRKDHSSPAVTTSESEDDIEIISSTIKTDSPPKKIVLLRDDAKGKPSERKPLPALERISIKSNVAKNTESVLKRIEPIKIQTLQSGRTMDQSGSSSISPPGMRKVSGTGPGPIKLKRNFGESSNPDQGSKKKLIEPSDPKSSSTTKTQSQFSSSEEIREILAKRLGSGLDISIVPPKTKESSVTIGDVEIIAQPQQISPSSRQEMMRSPPRVQIPHMQVPTSHSPSGSRPQLSPTYQQKLAMAQNYQASFANMINSAQNRLPVQSQSQPHLQKKSPPQGKQSQLLHQSQQHLQHSQVPHHSQQSQHTQQHHILSQTSQQPRMLGKDVMTSQFAERPSTSDQRRTVPLIIRRNDLSRKQEKKEEKVMPIKLSLREGDVSAGTVAKKLLGQTEMSTDSSCSSGSELQSSAAQSSASSQENPNYADGNIDFENMIGSSVVCKDTGLSPPNPNATSQQATYDPSKIQQPTVTLEPIPPEIIPVIPTPRKRGRPRKIQQQVLNTPTPVVGTWPQDGSDEQGGKPLGRGERRKRREAIKTILTKKREESMPADDSKGEDEGGDEATPKKKRFIPRSPKSQLKKKRRRGVYSVKKKQSTPRKLNAEKENVQNFEEETRMSATEVGSTPSRAMTLGDESQSSVNTEGQTSRTVSKKGRMEVVAESKPITVQQIVEYYWPPVGQLKPGEKPEGLMIQEQISEYLGVKSFKRKYPSIKRRAVEMEERNYLQENGYVSENMCDMGLTAVYSSDIIEIMYNDFPGKFEEYRKFAREKKAKEQKALREKQAAERADIDPKKEAIESAMSWNNEFNKTRRASHLILMPSKIL